MTNGLYEQRPPTYSAVNPILIIGIVLFVLPFFSSFLHFTIPNILKTIGLILILLGSIISIMKASNL